MRIETANLRRQELHNLIGNAITPLPIALISTIGPDGTHNAAPFSFVSPICVKPPVICISIGLRKGEKKDTLRNIEFSHDFVVNVVDEAIFKQAIQTSADYPSGVDELKKAGLTALKSDKVKSPRIAESKVSLECRLVQELELVEEAGLRAVVFGEVVLAHVKDDVWVDGNIEPSRLGAVGRIGQDIYCRATDIFQMKRPSI